MNDFDLGGALPATCRLGQCMLDEAMFQMFEIGEISYDRYMYKERKESGSKLAGPFPAPELTH